MEVGGRKQGVAVSPERCGSFGCFSAELRQMARWLIDTGVRSVAMQSTGEQNGKEI